MRGPFLGGAQPHILEVERARVLRLPVGSFRGPVERCRGTRGRHMRECIAEEYTPRVYNPSIAPAPAGLCERCAYVASVRVSHQHQCDSTGAINLGFEGAAIVLLDADFEVVAWDWWFQIPRRQLAHVEREYWGTRNFSWTPAENDASMHSTHPFFGGFAAPYPWSSYDVRVFTHGPSLMATFQCRACEAFNVPAVHLTGFRSDGRGLRGMRSWSLASHPVAATTCCASGRGTARRPSTGWRARIRAVPRRLRPVGAVVARSRRRARQHGRRGRAARAPRQ